MAIRCNTTVVVRYRETRDGTQIETIVFNEGTDREVVVIPNAAYLSVAECIRLHDTGVQLRNWKVEGVSS